MLKAVCTSRSALLRIAVTGVAAKCTVRAHDRGLSCDELESQKQRVHADTFVRRRHLGSVNNISQYSLSDVFRTLKHLPSICWRVLKSAYRTLQLMIIFSPALVASPLLLLSSPDLHLFWWSVFKRCIASSGPCFTKLAQWVSTRPDLFPSSICAELETLQVNASRHSWEETEKMLLSSLGPQVTQKLMILNKDASAGSGSAAQVYRGAYGSENIAIKVLHPGIHELMDYDLDILCLITSFAELFPGVASISLHEGVEEFAALLRQQLNLKAEAVALLRFRNNFKEKKWKEIVNFPMPMLDLTSEDILVETFEEGDSISKYLERDQRTKTKLAHMCLDILLKMVFEDNFVHGDLHGGNILVASNRSPSHAGGLAEEYLKLSIIDTGIAHTMSAHDRKNFIDVFYAFVRKDGKHIGRIMSDRSRGSVRIIDQRGFEESMALIVSDLHRKGLQNVGIGTLMQRVFTLCYKHQVKIESHYAAFIISVSIMEGLVRQLDPTVDILKKASPYIVKAALSEALFSN